MPKKLAENSDALDDMVFAMSGKFSRPKAELIADIEASGGTVKSSVTKEVTHLLTDGTAGTKKLEDAKKKGIAVVGEDWLEARIGGREDETGGKGTKRKKDDEDPEDDDDGDGNDDGDAKGGFEGKVFALSGKFSRVKGDIVSDIEAAGGVVKSSVTKDVTHLVTNETGGTKKIEDAKAKGVVIVDEEWVEAVLGGDEEEPPASKGAKKSKKADDEEDGEEDEAEGNGGLEGKVFALSGKFSRVKSEIVKDIEAAGGVVKSTVTKEVTHLVTNETDGTKKIEDAKTKGIAIVDEDWVETQLGGEAEEAPASKGTKRKKAEEDEDCEGDADGETDGFEGKIFALSGKFSRLKAEIISDIEAAGGVVKSTVTKDVTHLVTNEAEGTKKIDDAKRKGIAIVDEEWVVSRLGGKAGEGPAKGAKRKKADDDNTEDAEEEEDDAGGGAAVKGSAVFNGMVFALSGKFSRVKSELNADIEAAGGTVKSTVTKEVTHLLTNETGGTKKIDDAKSKGIIIVDEEWLTVQLGGEDEGDAEEAVPKSAKRKAEEVAPQDDENGGSSLEGMVFALSGKMSRVRSAISADIEAAGGTVKSSVTNEVTHLLTNETAGTKKIEDAKAKGINVVTEEWLESRLSGKKPDQPPPSPKKLKGEESEAGVKEEVPSTPAVVATGAAVKSTPSGARISARQSTALAGAIDPAAPGHLRGGTVYGEFDALLNQTDLKRNANKFIRVQLIQTSAGVTLHKRWGRVGEAGQQQQIGPLDSDKAEKEFLKYFKSKTSNNWADRDDFSARAGKYTLIDMEGDSEAAETQKASSSSTSPGPRPPAVKRQPSKLAAPVKKLVDLIFNEDMFKSAMADLEIDSDRLPLGALSKSQVQKGRAVLVRLQDALDEGARPSVIENLSGEFYTVIPHAFGRRRPPPINSSEALKGKFEMLNTLEDIESAQSTMKEAQEATPADSTNPSDVNYDALRCGLEEVVEKDASEEFTMITKYLNNTVGGYRSMTLEKIFRVDRNGEDDTFKEHDTLTNRRLLWHGTRVAVVAAILKSGLRIMPHSGGRVGRGIYLADMHEKSAGYTSPGGGKIIMFLVEAALGKEHDITVDDSSLVRAPEGHQSVVARGRIHPDPKDDITFTIDGREVTVPQGKRTDTTHKSSSFHHNEFLIYQESQHRIRYILQFHP